MRITEHNFGHRIKKVNVARAVLLPRVTTWLLPTHRPRIHSLESMHPKAFA